MHQTATVTSPARSLTRSFVGQASIVVAGSILMALSAHASIPLWFTPVPLTLQTLALMVIGLTFGRTAAFSTMVLYLAEGAVGLPVFSPAGPAGLLHLLGPTAGFLFCYPVAAPAAGAVTRLLQKRIPAFPAAVVGSLAATAIFLTSGASWLAHSAHLTAGAAIGLAVLPFLPGELIKVAIAAGLYNTLRSTSTNPSNLWID